MFAKGLHKTMEMLLAKFLGSVQCNKLNILQVIYVNSLGQLDKRTSGLRDYKSCAKVQLKKNMLYHKNRIDSRTGITGLYNSNRGLYQIHSVRVVSAGVDIQVYLLLIVIHTSQVPKMSSINFNF